MTNLTTKLLAYQLTGPGISANNQTAVSTLERIISTVLGVMTIVGIIYFTLQIILAGFSLIASQGDPKELQANKKRLTNNIVGLLVVVLAYGIGALIASLLGIPNIFNLTGNYTLTTPIQ